MLRYSLLGSALVLFLTLQTLATGDCWNVSRKQRHKREWVIPSKKIMENVDYSKNPIIGKIRSDMDSSVALRYTLRGPGINEPPVGCFMVEEYKGIVRITRPLDREERDNYDLTGTAWYSVNNSIAEDNIKIQVIVLDQNDNAPVFNKPERSNVYEGSPAGTNVTQVTATDADEPNTLHTKIVYTIIKQEPNNNNHFFAVDRDSGIISVKNPALDREEHNFYILTVQAADMDGNITGNSATVTVPIEIFDVNDNIPTLEKNEFSVSIDENEAPIEVLRIQALDSDEVHTDNWLAEIAIVSGNEDEHFSIVTDPRTNVGVLYLNKPLDFESESNLKLGLVVVNKAPSGAPLGSGAGGAAGASGAGGQSGASGAGGQSGASGAGGQSGASGAASQSGAAGSGGQSGASGSGGQSGAGPGIMLFGGSGSPGFIMPKQNKYIVNVNVKNKPEPPKFKPKIKPISVSENNKNYFPKVIDTYTATEEDTGKPAEKVKYAKGYDPDNWISIDMDTAEIKLNKVPDRESPFVVNGTYYAKIICITDELHSKTSTGTIALQVEDLNDNCPKLLDNIQTVCSETTVVNVTAEDTDSYPNGAPLEFSLIQEKTKGKWNMLKINDVSVSLLPEDGLWPGFYEVTMEIRDMQGLACPVEQVLHLEVCTCLEGNACGAKMAAVQAGASAKFGLSGISFLILGFIALILTLLILVKCNCGSAGNNFIDMPFETKQNLITYSTEARGEDRNVPLICPQLQHDNLGGYEMPNGHLRMAPAMNSKIPMDEIQALNLNQAVYTSPKLEAMQESEFGGFYYDSEDMEKTVSGFQDQEVLEDYLTQKYRYISGYDIPGEATKSYDYEGKGSMVGSIDSCSYNESNDDLEFLNNLDSKFITLAEVCGYRGTEYVSNATVNNVETTPTTDAFTTISSGQMTGIVQPNSLEINVNSPIVQAAPSQGLQEPLCYEFNQPIQSNVMLSEEGLGQGFYIINGTPNTDTLMIQGNSHTLAPLGSGQQGILANNIMGDSVVYSQLGPQSPIMIGEGLVEVNSAVSQTLSPTSNLVMMPQQQLDGMGSLQMLRVPVGSVVSGDNGQGSITCLDGSVSGGKVLVGGPLSTQQHYPLSEPTYRKQTINDGSFSFLHDNRHGSGAVDIVNQLQIRSSQVNNQVLVNVPISSAPNSLSLEGGEFGCAISGHNLLLAGTGQYPVSKSTGTANLGSVPQVATGRINNSQLLVGGQILSAPNIVSGEARERLLVNVPSMVESPASRDNLLVAGAVSTNLASMPQVATGQVNNSQLLVSGPISSVINIVSGEAKQSRQLVNGPSIIESSSHGPLVIRPGALSPVGFPQVANRQLFRSTASRVMTAMVMTPKSKGLMNVKQ